MPGFIDLLTKPRGPAVPSTAEANVIFGGEVGRWLLSSSEETAKATRMVFGNDVAHGIQNRFAEGERGITTAENVLVDPNNGQRVSTFPQLSVAATRSKREHANHSGPITGVISQDDSSLCMASGDFPGRSRLDLEDFIGLAYDSEKCLGDQLLFGFDPISEILKCVSSHMTVLHSFLMDVLSALEQHIKQWGPTALEGSGRGTELTFHEAAACVTRIKKTILAAHEATTVNKQQRGTRCCCCGESGHGKGPLVDPFLESVGASLPREKAKVSLHTPPPEFIVSKPNSRKRQAAAAAASGRNNSLAFAPATTCTALSTPAVVIAETLRRGRKREAIQSALDRINADRVKLAKTEEKAKDKDDEEGPLPPISPPLPLISPLSPGPPIIPSLIPNEEKIDRLAPSTRRDEIEPSEVWVRARDRTQRVSMSAAAMDGKNKNKERPFRDARY